jgi:hypothetical protein
MRLFGRDRPIFRHRMSVAALGILSLSILVSVNTGQGAAAAPRAHGFAGLNALHSNPAGLSRAGAPGVRARGNTPGLVDCEGDVVFCWSPGDPDIAAGPSEVIETINCAVGAFSKSNGALLWNVAVQDLFSRTESNFCADPRVIYIPWINRFAMVYWETGGDSGSPLLFAVSTNSNPSGAISDWHVYAAPSGSYDQPKIEATGTNLIVGGNNSTVTYFVYDLNQVASGVVQPAVQQVQDTVGLTLASVDYSQPPNGVAYFVSAGTSGISLSVISGRPTQGNVAISHQTFATPTFAQTTEPVIPGGSLGGGDMDNRVLAAAYEVQTSNNHPVIEFSGNTECTNQTQVCAYDVKLDLSTTPARVVKNVQLGATGSSFAYGSVTLDARGNGYLAYSRTSPSATPQSNALATNGSGTTLWNVTTQAQTAGTTSCGSSDTPPCSERWGDYFGGAQDPSNRNVVCWWPRSSPAVAGAAGAPPSPGPTPPA